MKRQPDSHILKHQELAHPDQEQPNFEFRIKGSFRSALERQVTEAVLIRRAGAAALNSKGVYNRCSLPRLAVEIENKTSKEQTDKEKKPDPIMWQCKKRPKRADLEQARRPRKKQRVEKEGGELTIQGVRKRKAAELKSLDEFNSECKKMRPEFDPELECGNPSQNEDKEAVKNSIISTKSKNQIIFFSVFSKSNKELNNQVMFKCSNKPKLKSKLRKKKNDSSQTGKGGRGVDIRTFLKPMIKPGEAKQETDRQTNTPPPSATDRLDLGPELSKSKTKLEQRVGPIRESLPRPKTPDETTDREGESGIAAVVNNCCPFMHCHLYH